MSSNNEIKGSNFKKGSLDLAALDANGQQPLSQLAIKPTVQVVGGGTKAWSTPGSFATDSLSTSGNLDSAATITYNATYYGQTNNVSANAWFKTSDSQSAVGTIFAHSGFNSPEDRKWWMYMLNGKLNVLITDTGWTGAEGKIYTSVDSFDDDEWHMMTFTFTTNTLKVYVDEVELTVGASTLVKTQDDTVNTLHVSTSPIVLSSAWSTTTTQPTLAFDGLACQYSYWSVELSSSEVSELYNLGRAWDISGHSQFANCESWHRVDGSDGSTIADSTGNGNTATVVGSASISSDAPNSGGDFTFDEDMQVEVSGVPYSANNILSTSSPISLTEDKKVAYATLNTFGAGGNITVTQNVNLEDVPSGASVIARRDGTDFIIGSRVYS